MRNCTRIMGLGLAGAILTVSVALGQDPTFSLEAVEVNGVKLPKPTGKITVAPGDEMTLHLFVRDWGPNGERIRALQIQIDDRGYTSGMTGSIHPKDYQTTTLSEFENKTNAFIDREDPRYVFKGIASIPVVDTLSWGYRYLNISVAESDAPESPQDGTRFYCGTLNVKVSDDASGTLLYGLVDDPGATTARDAENVEILPLKTEALVIDVVKSALVHRILGSEPPPGSIDARTTRDGRGWERIDLTFNADAAELTPEMFSVADGTNDPPMVKSVSANGTHLVVQFDRGIRPTRWTHLVHKASTSSTTVGCLPGDVNADGTVDAADILLLAAQSREEKPLPLYSTDIDRDGKCGPGDALRLIDLLNDESAYRRHLP